MRKEFQVAAVPVERREAPALRIYLDANVWVSFLAGLSRGKTDTAVIRLGQFVNRMTTGDIPLQLVVSLDLLDTLRRVLPRQGVPQNEADEFVDSLIDLMRHGPENLDPVIVLGGREQLAMRDEENAGILAACIAANVRLLVTDNLRDFETSDSERVDTRELTRRDGTKRQLYAILHERPRDGSSVVVLHPADAIDCLTNGIWPTAEKICEKYA